MPLKTILLSVGLMLASLTIYAQANTGNGSVAAPPAAIAPDRTAKEPTIKRDTVTGEIKVSRRNKAESQRLKSQSKNRRPAPADSMMHRKPYAVPQDTGNK